jgi:hypothetical protein
MLKTTSAGFGYLAFAGLSTWAAEKKAGPLDARKPHFPARAKHVIFLCMEGAPSHVDTFDYKPKLTTDDGKAFTRSRVGGGRLLASPFKFQQSGKSGLWISELYPELSQHADELCLLNGVYTDVPAHPQAFLQMHTGMSQFPRPSMGSWVLYGLGSENENVPGFVSISPPGQNGGPANFGSSFLPPVYQGTPIRGGGGFGGGGRGNGEATVSNLTNPQRSTTAQRTQLDFIQELNRSAHQQDPLDPSVDGLIESYELAFRMQGELPKLLNTANESAAVRKLYGVDEQATQNFGRQCLLARRLVEAGVRFVEVTSGGWDHHRDLKASITRTTQATDKPIAGLIADLKSRGLLKDTLIIWGGEFGRTPYAQGTDGRDHNSRGYTMWFAGGGVKGGFRYGATDEYGYEAVEGKMHTHDWHATMLHLLGLDHERLTFRHAGRDFRLTDVKGNVVKEIMA